MLITTMYFLLLRAIIHGICENVGGFPFQHIQTDRTSIFSGNMEVKKSFAPSNGFNHIHSAVKRDLNSNSANTLCKCSPQSSALEMDAAIAGNGCAINQQTFRTDTNLGVRTQFSIQTGDAKTASVPNCTSSSIAQSPAHITIPELNVPLGGVTIRNGTPVGITCTCSLKSKSDSLTASSSTLPISITTANNNLSMWHHKTFSQSTTAASSVNDATVQTTGIAATANSSMDAPVGIGMPSISSILPQATTIQGSTSSTSANRTRMKFTEFINITAVTQRPALTSSANSGRQLEQKPLGNAANITNASSFITATTTTPLHEVTTSSSKLRFNSPSSTAVQNNSVVGVMRGTRLFPGSYVGAAAETVASSAESTPETTTDKAVVTTNTAERTSSGLPDNPNVSFCKDTLTATACEDELGDACTILNEPNDLNIDPKCNDAKYAAIANKCRRRCLSCCIHPDYKCINSPDPVMDCEFAVKQHLCNTTNYLMKMILAQDCPASCGLCNYCADDGSNCYLMVNYCTHPLYEELMTKKCRKTCGKCYSETSCRDSSSRCALWVSNGFCENAEFTLEDKKKHCKKSCKLC